MGFCLFLIWQIINIKNEKFYYIEAAELLVVKIHKQKKKLLRTISELFFMLFEGARCRTIENICSPLKRYIAVTYCLTGHLSSRSVGLLNLQAFEVCFVCFICKVKYCQIFIYFF